MYDIPTDRCVHKAYVHDYSTQQKPGVKAKRLAGCIAQRFRITEAGKSNYEMQAAIMQLGFMVHWEIKKSGHNSRDIFFAGRAACISFQSAKLLFKFWGPCTTQINSGSHIPIYRSPKCSFLTHFHWFNHTDCFFSLSLFLVLAEACGISGEGFTVSPTEVREAASSPLSLSLLLFSCWRCREWDCIPSPSLFHHPHWEKRTGA